MDLPVINSRKYFRRCHYRRRLPYGEYIIPINFAAGFLAVNFLPYLKIRYTKFLCKKSCCWRAFLRFWYNGFFGITKLIPNLVQKWQAMLVFIHPCNLVGEMPQTPERFQRNRLRSSGSEHHSILKSESGIFRLTAFRQIRFFFISVDRHLAKVSAHILCPKLRHPRLDQAELSFIYEKFDLYRSFAIPVIWHYFDPLHRLRPIQPLHQ